MIYVTYLNNCHRRICSSYLPSFNQYFALGNANLCYVTFLSSSTLFSAHKTSLRYLSYSFNSFFGTQDLLALPFLLLQLFFRHARPPCVTFLTPSTLFSARKTSLRYLSYSLNFIFGTQDLLALPFLLPKLFFRHARPPCVTFLTPSTLFSARKTSLRYLSYSFNFIFGTQPQPPFTPTPQLLKKKVPVTHIPRLQVLSTLLLHYFLQCLSNCFNNKL